MLDRHLVAFFWSWDTCEKAVKWPPLHLNHGGRLVLSIIANKTSKFIRVMLIQSGHCMVQLVSGDKGG